MSPQEKIADRVRKLLAKSESTDSEGEAKLLLDKALELISSYGIDPELLKEDQQDVVFRLTDYRISILFISKSKIAWRSGLAGCAAEATGCKVVNAYTYSSQLDKHISDADRERLAEWRKQNGPRGRVVTVTGKEEDRAVCKALFDYLCNTCTDLVNNYMHKLREGEVRSYRTPRQAGQDYRLSYCEGVYHQIVKMRLRQRKRADKNALVSLDSHDADLARAVTEIWGRLQGGRARDYVHNGAAYGNGSKAYLGRNTVGGGNGSIALGSGK